MNNRLHTHSVETCSEGCRQQEWNRGRAGPGPLSIMSIPQPSEPAPVQTANQQGRTNSELMMDTTRKQRGKTYRSCTLYSPFGTGLCFPFFNDLHERFRARQRIDPLRKSVDRRGRHTSSPSTYSFNSAQLDTVFRGRISSQYADDPKLTPVDSSVSDSTGHMRTQSVCSPARSGRRTNGCQKATVDSSRPASGKMRAEGGIRPSGFIEDMLKPACASSVLLPQ